MLAASGHPVSPITLRSWKHRKRISRGPGYDLAEILRYIEIRENRMAVWSKPTPDQINWVAKELEDLAKRLREDATREHPLLKEYDLDMERDFSDSNIYGMNPEPVQERLVIKLVMGVLPGEGA